MSTRSTLCEYSEQPAWTESGWTDRNNAPLYRCFQDSARSAPPVPEPAFPPSPQAPGTHRYSHLVPLGRRCVWTGASRPHDGEAEGAEGADESAAAERLRWLAAAVNTHTDRPVASPAGPALEAVLCDVPVRLPGLIKFIMITVPGRGVFML